MRELILLGVAGAIVLFLFADKTGIQQMAEGQIPKLTPSLEVRKAEPKPFGEVTAVVSAPEPFHTGDSADGGVIRVTSISPFDYLKEKYPLVPEWTAEGEPVVKYYRGQSAEEKAQIKAAWKEYDKLKRALESGHTSIGEWQAARKAEERAIHGVFEAVTQTIQKEKEKQKYIHPENEVKTLQQRIQESTPLPVTTSGTIGQTFNLEAIPIPTQWKKVQEIIL